MKRRSTGWGGEILNSVWEFLKNIVIFQHLLARRKILSMSTHYEVGSDSLVDIAIRYGLDGPGIESR
jgi:hypothetical protein